LTISRGMIYLTGSMLKKASNHGTVSAKTPDFDRRLLHLYCFLKD
jgi:hypothetical protein